MKKRSIKIAGHATSVSLEDEFWTELKDIATRRGVSLNQLAAEADLGRGGNLSSALRLLVLGDLRRRAGCAAPAG
jgi:predicted DNA-binding ribbon-helix-helix protein